jgi:hypothetical protein
VITQPSPLRIISPPVGQTIAASGKDLPFSWADDNGGNEYRLVVARDAAFESVVETRKVSTRAVAMPIATTPGQEYFWEALLLNPDGTVASRSETGSFRVYSRLDAVSPMSPTGGVKIDINETAEISFRWKPVEHADAYSLTLFRVTAGLLTEIHSWDTRDTQFMLDNYEGLTIDSYAWRIFAHAESRDSGYAPGEPVVSYFRIVKSRKLSAPRVIRTSSIGAFK